MDASEIITALSLLLVIGALIFVGQVRSQERPKPRRGVVLRPEVVKKIIEQRVRDRRRGSAD